MKTTLFLIPGFRQNIEQPAFAQIKTLCDKLNTQVIPVNINWTRTSLTDWLHQFEEIYAKHPTEKTWILGFSYGAMISLALSSTMKIDKQILCSLSPYFKEDLAEILSIVGEQREYKETGKFRFKDFEKYSCKDLTHNNITNTTLMYGEKELNILKHRVLETHKYLVKSKIVKVKGVGHNINDKNYMESVLECIRTLD